MNQRFIRFIAEKRLCTREDHILLAVSGGKDSVALFHLFLENGFRFAVAHAHFQLRGADADQDQAFVKKLCQKKSIPFYTKKFNTRLFAKQNSLSIQMAARELRYAWFQQLTATHQFDVVATAHHANDSIETVLLNFARGSGLEGWDGIAPNTGKIIRPLLFATRKQIDEYVKKNKLKWREDKSNATDDYQRNFIRHKILPQLKKINPSLENSFVESIEKITGSNELMQTGIVYWKKKFCSEKNDQVHLSKKGLKLFQHPEGVLWNLIKNYGFNLDQCNQIIRSVSEQPGKKFVSKKYELVIDRSALVITPHQGEWSELKIKKNQTEAELEGCLLLLSEKKEAEIPKGNSIALLDLARLQFPLVWRKWKTGDYFYPLGMNHKKKVSDFLINQKISVAEKNRVSVLTSGGEIVWVVGHRISDHFKVTEGTKKFLQVSLVR
ncbi:MAG: tRNA(Ile)-lysidine synthetase [Cytophagales bacterium]|jgi:tRNA(Ile)-lysidine synthase|nr:tRNA lysidine(34) synthetase TilS [Bacteroidota bacterium]MBS1980559.1 tRNA lysidine(34) synthetase TilS [Bacteroidota bacterium]WHZ07881.1 MAG: tRNA(Ile)-lysidine synthetase [Cytophagales bacterium]